MQHGQRSPCLRKGYAAMIPYNANDKIVYLATTHRLDRRPEIVEGTTIGETDHRESLTAIQGGTTPGLPPGPRRIPRPLRTGTRV